MNQKGKIIFLISVFVVLGILLYSAGVFPRTKLGNESESTGTQVASTTTITKGGVTAEGGDFSIEPDSGKSVMTPTQIKPEPNLTGTIVFSKELSAEARGILEEKISVLVAKIKSGESTYQNWFDMGNLLKTAGDYGLARECLEYALDINDTDPVLHSNLATLYGYYLKDNGLAETHFLKAIELEPSVSSWYVRLSNFYKDVVQDTDLAKMILAKGLSLIPGDSTLTNALNSL